MATIPEVEARRSIVVDYHLDAASAIVWRLLPDPGVTREMAYAKRYQPQHRSSFQVPNGSGSRIRWHGHCEIMEAQPVSRLVYSWRGGSINTVVTWTLDPSASGGTHPLLEQLGFGPEDGVVYDMLGRGWPEKAPGPLNRIASSIK